MTLVYGLALAIIAIVYLFVSAGGIPWPGGPQLQPEAARNLSLSLIGVGLLMCGLLLGSVVQPAAQSSTRQARTLSANPNQTATTATASPGVTGGSETAAAIGATETIPSESALTIQPIPSLSPFPTATSTVTPAPTQAPAPTETPVPTATPATLPLDPRELVETVLRTVIERANDAEVEAILSGDEGAVDPWWAGEARDRVAENVRRVRSRFVEITEVTWAPSGEGIRLLSSSAVTATYITSETWTFIGKIAQRCPDGSTMSRRYVETYPSEQYTLELREGAYSVSGWQLGQPVTDEVRTFCP